MKISHFYKLLVCVAMLVSCSDQSTLVPLNFSTPTAVSTPVPNRTSTSHPATSEPGSVTPPVIESPEPAPENQAPTTPFSSLEPTETPTLTSPLIIAVENVGQLSQVTRWGKGRVEKTVLSPDNKTLAVATSAGVFLYDIQTFTETRLDVDASVNDVAFDPQGRFIAMASDTFAALIDTDTGQSITTLNERGPFWSIAVSPDGAFLALGARGLVQIWDTQSHDLVRALDAGTDVIGTIAFSPDGQKLVTGGWFDECCFSLQLWDLTSGEAIYNLGDELRYTEQQAVFSPDGSLVASASIGRIRLWDTNTGELVRTLKVDDRIPSIAFSTNGGTLISGSDTIRIWNLNDWELMHTIDSPADDVMVGSDGLELISSDGLEISFWNLDDQQPAKKFKLLDYTDSISDIRFSPDGQTLAFGGSDDTLRLWDMLTGEIKHSIETHSEIIAGLAFNPDGRTLATSGCGEVNTGLGFHCLQGVIRLWDIETGDVIHSLEGDLNGFGEIEFSPDGRVLASNGPDETILIWDILSGTVQNKLNRASFAFAFVPGGQLLASTSGSKIVFWKLSSGEVLQEFAYVGAYSEEIEFSPGGQTFAVTDGNHIQILDRSSGQLLHQLDGHSSRVNCVAFSPDGRLLASGSGDTTREFTIRLWDVSTGKLLRTIHNPTGSVQALAFSQDGLLLASGDISGVIRLWGIK